MDASVQGTQRTVDRVVGELGPSADCEAALSVTVPPTPEQIRCGGARVNSDPNVQLFCLGHRPGPGCGRLVAALAGSAKKALSRRLISFFIQNMPAT